MTNTSNVSQLHARRVALLAMAVAALPAMAATTRPADLPVKSVTLYTSGVGFFQHAGAVQGDGSVTLKFKTAQINDVIKSLVVQDDGGRVLGVRYPSQDPLNKTLKTFQIDLTGDTSMAGLLVQLRGARVTAVRSDTTKLTGTVVSVDKRQRPTPGSHAIVDTFVLNLFDGGGVRAIDLTDVNTIELEDANLRDELKQALAAVVAGRDQDKKPVTVAFTGQGDHRLRLGYVVETPVWKTAYRLLLKDPSAKADAKDHLQGWAVVENQTDADWNDVTLSLVSGRPLSFVMDLYQPLYLQRPVVELSLFQGLKPPVYQEGVQNAAFGGGAMLKAAQKSNRFGLAAPAAPASMPLSEAMAAETQSYFAGDAVRSPAITAKLGELFQYTIEHVTLPRQQSSLVPIVTDTVTTEPLSIYNETVLPRNPLTGVMLTNSTGKLLPQGPITVLSGGVYAGDARIEDLPAGQKRLLSFGVDLETFVDVKTDAQSTLVGGKIVKGVLTLSRRVSQAKAYAVQNKGDKDRTLVIEHMLLDGWDLVDTPEPYDKTDRRYRFRLPVAKGKTETLKVTQQQTQAEQVMVLNADLDGLLFNSRQGALPQKVRDALAEVITRRQAMDDLERQSKEKAEAIDRITVEQQRLRENMQIVDRGGAYYTRLLTKLNDQESRIETLQKERDEIDGKVRMAREAFEQYLAELSVD